MLSFKARFVEPVLSGEKRQTLRKATSLREGDIVTLTCRWGEPAFARVRVTKVEQVSRSRLTAADAHADGFATLREMLDWLDSTYGVVRRLSRVSFELVEASGQ